MGVSILLSVRPNPLFKSFSVHEEALSCVPVSFKISGPYSAGIVKHNGSSRHGKDGHSRADLLCHGGEGGLGDVQDPIESAQVSVPFLLPGWRSEESGKYRQATADASCPRPMLSERHVNMMSFSQCIGIGLFLQTGRVIYLVGPGLATICYVLAGKLPQCVWNPGQAVILKPPFLGRYRALVRCRLPRRDGCALPSKGAHH